MENKNIFKELRLNEVANLKSIRKLAKEIGISASHICEIEKGKKPSLAEMKAYHEYFNVSYEYLLGETTEKRSSDVFSTKRGVTSAEKQLIEIKNQGENNNSYKQLYKLAEFMLCDVRGFVLAQYLAEYILEKKGQEDVLNCINEYRNVDQYKGMKVWELKMKLNERKKSNKRPLA